MMNDIALLDEAEALAANGGSRSAPSISFTLLSARASNQSRQTAIVLGAACTSVVQGTSQTAVALNG